MKILVTGGAGFIGTHIVKKLLSRGYEVTIFDSLRTGKRENVPEAARLIVGDIRNFNEINAAVSGHDAIIHLAAQALVQESMREPEVTFAINLNGGRNLLEAMRRNDVKKLVYSSTAAVYGASEKQPIEEDDPKLPINPYGQSKLELERECHKYHEEHGFDITTFRYFNPFGPGEDHEPETHAVPNFIRAVIEQQPIPLYWNGDQTRDFFFVEDLAGAHVDALDQKGYRIYNLGLGQEKGTKVRDLIELIFEIAGKRTEIKDLGERLGDPPVLVASTARAQAELGWQPTPLREALEQTYEWMRSRN